MYGLIGKIASTAGNRDELIRVLINGTKDMPGNIRYIVSRDNNDENGIWITEVWESREAHQASLELPTVRDAIEKGKPLISAFEQSVEVTPIGGKGL